jgi:hypothetical protein
MRTRRPGLADADRKHLATGDQEESVGKRIDFIFNHNLYFYCLDGVIVLGALRDLVVDRRIHKVYLVALPALLVCHVFVVYTYSSASAWWLRIARGIID